MKKEIYIGIGLLVLGLVVFFSLQSSEKTNSTLVENNDITAPMPLPDSPAVPEMVVEDVTESTSDTPAVVEGTTKTFTIDSYSYGYDVKEIRVTEGDTVTINLTNSAGLHDWVVDEFDAATEIIRAGEETSVTFVADKVGTYEYYCSVGNHRAQGMIGTLIVESR